MGRFVVSCCSAAGNDMLSSFKGDWIGCDDSSAVVCLSDDALLVLLIVGWLSFPVDATGTFAATLDDGRRSAPGRNNGRFFLAAPLFAAPPKGGTNKVGTESGDDITKFVPSRIGIIVDH